jgi:cytochrome P450
MKILSDEFYEDAVPTFVTHTFADALGTAAANELAPVVESCVREVLEPLLQRAEVDMMSEFAAVLPLRVSATLLGVDVSVVERAQTLIDREVLEVLARSLESSAKGAPIFRKVMAMGTFSREECITACLRALFAAHDAAATLLATCIVRLAGAEPNVVDDAVRGPVTEDARLAQVEVDLAVRALVESGRPFEIAGEVSATKLPVRFVDVRR